MKTLDEKLAEDAKPNENIGKVDKDAILNDPAIPDACAATKPSADLHGVTDPENRLDKASGPEALARLKSGPHRPAVTLIDGTTVSTGGEGKSA